MPSEVYEVYLLTSFPEVRRTDFMPEEAPDGSIPLSNRKHEAFAKAVASGKSAAAAYRKQFQKASIRTAETHGPALARECQVAVRVEWLKAQAVEAARLKAAKWVKSRGEWIAWLGQAVLTPVGKIDEKSVFAQEVTRVRKVVGTGDEAEEYEVEKIKAVGKIDALKLIGAWSKFETGSEADNKLADGLSAVRDAVRKITHGRNKPAG